MAKLEEPMPMRFPSETPLIEVLSYIQKAAKKEPNGLYLPIYVDPIGLQEAEKSLNSTIQIDLPNTSLKSSLSLLLQQVALAYYVKDGVLIITASESVAEVMKGATAVRTADALPKTKAMVARLEEPMAMKFAQETPLDRVVNYIKEASQKGPNGSEIPIYVNPIGLQEAERSMSSTIRIDLEGVPLRASLRLLLMQLGLGYYVKDGVLTITALETMDEELGKAAENKPGDAPASEGGVPANPAERPAQAPVEKPPVSPAAAIPAAGAEPEFLTTRIGQIKLKRIPVGQFVMGSPVGEGRPDEHPQHEVRITRPFYLGVFEVTQGQYRAVMGNNPSHFEGSDDLPVESVSWPNTVRFCNKLSEREGRKPYYQIDGDMVTIAGGYGYRLPTEAEWEYACRAGTSTRFPFGDDENALGQYGWFSVNSNRRTHPVGERQPNAFGLYDMHGNVWEWCWDGYGAAYYKRSPLNDPQGPERASVRVHRGGGWPTAPHFAESAARNGSGPVHLSYDLGFRLARVQSDH